MESTHPEVASEVTAFLSRSGIANNFAAAGCGIVLARVDRVGGGLQVRIKDASGRISQRDVSSVAAAGALIESWARSDVPASLLFPIDEGDATVVDVQRDAIASAPVVAAVFGVAFSAETTVSDDGSSWMGARASGCVRVGAVCVGVLGRFASDMENQRPASEVARERTAVDGLLGVGMPIGIGGLTLQPGVAFGVGWLRSQITQFESTRNANEDVEVDGDADAEEEEDSLVTDVRSGVGLRAEASMTLGWKVHRAIGVELTLATTVAPAAETVDESLLLYRGSIGVRWGTP
ncbi:MAG: hypothetical protein SGI86_17035 [Deltaproteobacteria bacterium]|nr:hypothetical protein [Deltaproteobacteria bacterium]